MQRLLSWTTVPALAFAALTALPATPLAQTGTNTETTPPPNEFADLHPAQRLGLRIENTRRQIPVAPAVVLVADQTEFLQALAQWSLAARYPVLIDDGTPEAAEDIARFVRAFEPETVIRWSAQRPAQSGDEPSPEGLADRVIASAWRRSPEDDPAPTAAEAFEGVSLTPPGVVVSHPEDPAWPAAVALAAAHGQILVDVDPPHGHVGRFLNPRDLDDLRLSIFNAIDEHGLNALVLGDDIDALTIALDMPSKMRIGPENSRTILATTDVLPRRPSGQRWAWAGQLFGSSPEAVYDAMCSIFLRPERAFFFDGYERGFAPPYVVTQANELLARAGITSDVEHARQADAHRWRTLTERGIDAHLIAVNTKGRAKDFEIKAAFMRTDDVPILHEPAFVHFIHSFSLQSPHDPTTVGRRWLDHGAFAYYGSADEPMLSAFVPPDQLSRRLAGAMPASAAARIDNAKPWKLNFFGDPLWLAIGSDPPKADDALRPAGTPLTDELNASLKPDEGPRDFARGVRALVLLGRDEHAARLAQGLLAAEDQPLPEAAAFTAMLAAFRHGDRELVADLFERLPADLRSRDTPRVVLWHALRREVDGSDALARRATQLLSLHIPAVSRRWWARQLRPHVERHLGEVGVAEMYAELLDTARNDRERQQLQDDLGGPR